MAQPNPVELTETLAALRARVEGIELLPPKEVDARLVALGYRGQPQARRAAGVLAYRHVRRLRRLFVEGISARTLPPRDNYLFIGPTGAGKTHLVELLFSQVLKVPTVTVDITQYSETGYIGEDVNMILSRLFEAAEQDIGWTACGAVCIDEFDKLASSRSSTRFAGEGTTKDVSGFGVQRGLLTMLSSSETEFPADFGYAHMGPKLRLPLLGLTFIACGAFSGLKAVTDLMGSDEHIGFGRTQRKHADPDSIAVELDDKLLEQTAAFARYGFLPELMGRFSRVVSFKPLDAATLRQILVDNVLTAYRREFNLEGLTLDVDDAVLDHIVRGAEKREVGARGLRAALAPFLEEAAYEAFGGANGRVHMRLVDGRIVTAVEAGSPA